MISDRIAFTILETAGYCLTEIVHHVWRWAGEHPRRQWLADLVNPLSRLGGWCYGRATDFGLRCGELVPNPRAGDDIHEPLYITKAQAEARHG